MKDNGEHCKGKIKIHAYIKFYNERLPLHITT